MTQTTRDGAEMDHEQVPDNKYQAADWLRARNPWLDQLVQRIAGDSDNWLDEIVGAVLDDTDHAAAMATYMQNNPEPFGDDEWATWESAGPQRTTRAHDFAVMSSSEQRVIRLAATLGYLVEADFDSHIMRRVPWSVDDINFGDQRGARLVEDWIRIVRAQLPESLSRSSASGR